MLHVQHDQETIFESPEVAVVEEISSSSVPSTAPSLFDPEMAFIERAKINTSTSFEYFNQEEAKSLNSIGSQEYFFYAAGNEKKMESPHQRLQRLRSELKELSDDLNSFVENDPSSLWSSLQHEAGKLLAEADGLRSHRAWQYHPSSKLQEVLSSTTSSNAATDAPGHSLSDLMKSNLSSLELERRIHRLETLLGQQSNNFDCYSSSSSSTGNPSHCKDLFPVMETLSNLERKLSLLDPQTIESIRAKTNLLKWELESLAGKKKDGAVAVGAQEAKGLEVMRKVEDLVGQVGKVRAIADDLPALVLRLKTLETTHWAAASAQARLVQLEKDVRTALGTASENCKLLNSMKEGLEENMRTVENNLRKLEQRS